MAHIDDMHAETVVVYLPHNAGMDGLDADVLAVEVQSVHQGLGGPDQFVALTVAGADAELPLQIHLDVVGRWC